jgi:preprotein translocase subunit YajC
VILAQASDAQGSGVTTLLLLAFLGVVFYLMIIRPQRTRMRKQKELADSLEVGDQIQTIGGVQGTVRSIDDTTVVIQVEDGRLRFSKRAIATKLDQE